MFNKLKLCFHQSPGSSREKFSGAEQYEIVYPQKLHVVHRRAAGTSSEVGKEIISWVILGDGERFVELKHPWVPRVREFGRTFALLKDRMWRSEVLFSEEELRCPQRRESLRPSLNLCLCKDVGFDTTQGFNNLWTLELGLNESNH